MAGIKRRNISVLLVAAAQSGAFCNGRYTRCGVLFAPLLSVVGPLVFLSGCGSGYIDGDSPANAAARAFPTNGHCGERDDNTVSSFVVDAATGELRSSGSVASGGSAPIALAVDPGGRFAYVANLIAGGGDVGGGGIAAFSIDAATGALTPVSSPVAAGEGPRTVIVHPSGRFLMARSLLSDNIFAYAIDSGTGALSSIGSQFRLVGGRYLWLWTLKRKFAYVVNGDDNTVSVFVIDPNTGALTQSGNPVRVDGFDPSSLMVHTSGKFAYVAESVSQVIAPFAVDPVSGGLTPLGSPVPSCGTFPLAIAGDPRGRFLYVSDVGTGDICTFEVNSVTGALSPIGLPVRSRRWAGLDDRRFLRQVFIRGQLSIGYRI